MSAIIGLDAPLKACEESAEGQVVSPVNYNSPGRGYRRAQRGR